VRFLADMTACILANRRSVPPFGLGGADGAVGAAWVERVDGSVDRLGSTAKVDMMVGDVFVIETPGGGGFGGD
jgi:5-oxoprolinase (ATP-hydrolysing)